MQRLILVNKIVDVLNEKLIRLRETIRETQETIDQAPTAMQSHSDTTRFQLGTLLDNYRGMERNIEMAIGNIRGNVAVVDVVAPSAIVKVDKSGKISYYSVSFISLEKPIIIDGEEIWVISKDTPLGRSLLNKKVGEEAEVTAPTGGFKVKILEIN